MLLKIKICTKNIGFSCFQLQTLTFFIFIQHKARAMKSHHSWSDESVVLSGTFLCQIIVAYNCYMNGVNHADQLRSINPWKRKEKRLYMNLFTYFLDLCLVSTLYFIIMEQNCCLVIVFMISREIFVNSWWLYINIEIYSRFFTPFCATGPCEGCTHNTLIQKSHHNAAHHNRRRFQSI